jgi:hypothetical protein
MRYGLPLFSLISPQERRNVLAKRHPTAWLLSVNV